MMYDDIANSTQNPVPGQIFNTIGGSDVYHGVPKDYVKNDVTAANFLKILSGHDMTGTGSGKTIKSGPNSKIFVYFADHGAPGLVAMPVGPYLYAKDLITTIHEMHDSQKYGKLVLYIEACESGSMFDTILPNNINVYGFTASNPHVSSYACDYDNKVKTYLNDCWSRNFLVDTESNDVYKRTFLQQFTAVKSQTTESPACAYGDLSLQSELLAEFMASKNASPIKAGNPASGSKISSRDVYEDYLKKQVEFSSNSVEALSARAELKKFYEQAARADIVYGAFAHGLNLNTKESNDDDRCHSNNQLNISCIKEVTEAHNAICGQYNEYSIRYGKYISKACSAHSSDRIIQELNKVCSVVRI